MTQVPGQYDKSLNAGRGRYQHVRQLWRSDVCQCARLNTPCRHRYGDIEGDNAACVKFDNAQQPDAQVVGPPLAPGSSQPMNAAFDLDQADRCEIERVGVSLKPLGELLV